MASSSSCISYVCFITGVLEGLVISCTCPMLIDEVGNASEPTPPIPQMLIGACAWAFGQAST